MKEQILLKRRYLIVDENADKKNALYLSIKLLNQFGIVVDKPKLLSNKNLITLSNFYGEKIPASFYKNPQDTKYYSCDELLIEQLVSYLKIESTDPFSLDESVFERVPVFKKILPKYNKGDEVVLRKYKMITEIESEKILKEILLNFCSYTRPWAIDEKNEFFWLYLNGYYNGEPVKCKDNIILALMEYKNDFFAKMLDKKDVVKLSVKLVGEKKAFSIPDDKKILLELVIKNAKDCFLTKKQAKYYNRIIKKLNLELPLENNLSSPFSIAKKLIDKRDIIEATKLFAQNGSLLERNLIFLLSRAKKEEIGEILSYVKDKNPIVLIQLLQGILLDDYSKPRIFKFFKDNTMKNHVETEYEFTHRKSKLSKATKMMVKKVMLEKIEKYYKSKESLGNIYIDSEFKHLGLPLNTSAIGTGLDVLPTGSRLPINGKYIRTFSYWKDAFDIDASVVFLHSKNNPQILYWGNYSKKLFGNSALTSGDNRDRNGSEFIDFDIEELKALGYKYAVFTLNGYGSTLNSGEIYCGYQNKDNLNTKVWAPNNIELKIHVKGESRAYIGFAIDFDTNEIVIINQVLASDASVVSSGVVKSILPYLNTNYLSNFNLYKLLSLRGNVIKSKTKADYVFDRNYEAKENQQVIRPYNIEKLVNLLI